MEKNEPLKCAEADDVALLFSANWSSITPSSIRLFGPGLTETKKGQFLFDEQAAAQVMARFADQGMDRLPFDVAHGMLNPSAPPDAHRALGWFIPVVRPDIEGGTGELALYADDIEWTEAGLEALQKREFRFFSPAITFEAESRRITGLINVALTNIPATKNQRPLVLDALEAEENNNEDQEMKELLAVLGASDETSAVAQVEAQKAFQAAVLSALDCGADDVAEKIAALSAAATEAQAELAALKVEKAKAERAVKLDALTAEGKLPPAQREFAASLSDEQFAAFASTLTVHNVIAQKVESAAPKGKVESLSADELKTAKLIAEQLGLSVEDVTEG